MNNFDIFAETVMSTAYQITITEKEVIVLSPTVPPPTVDDDEIKVMAQL